MPTQQSFRNMIPTMPIPSFLNQRLIRQTFSRATRRQQKRINVVRNQHLGQSCYIFGDGISLKYFDLKLFGNLPAIVTAKVPLHVEIGFLDAKYWVLPEPVFCWPSPWTPYSKTKRRLHSPYRVRKLGIQPIMHATNFPFTFGTRSFFIFDDFYDDSLDNSFITRNTTGFKDTFTAAISTAIYLGFSQAYLVGFDYTHCPSRTGHWYEFGTGNISNHKNYNRDFIEEASKSIELTTITLDGTSDLLPSISYEAFTGDSPKLQNNLDLLSPDDVYLLRKLPYYQIGPDF